MDYDKIVEKIGEFNYIPTEEELLLADDSGWTIAHVLASKGKIDINSELCMLHDKQNWTVAHQLATVKVLPKDFKFWKLVDFYGKSVLHVAAEHGHLWPEATLAEVHRIYSGQDYQGMRPWDRRMEYSRRKFTELKGILKR